MTERDGGSSTRDPGDAGRRCGRCGAKARADAIVCISCGALLAAYDAPAGSTETADSVPPTEVAPSTASTRPTAPSRSMSSDDAAAVALPPAPVPPSHRTPAATSSQGAVSSPHVPPPTPSPTTRPPREALPLASTPAPTPPRPASAPRPPDTAAVRPTEPARFTDGPEEDRPEPEEAPPIRVEAPSPPMQTPRVSSRPAARPISDYPARNILTRQTPQTVLIVGIGLLLGVCVMASVLAGTGADVAAGFFIICGGPLALLVLGVGIVLLITRGRGDRF